MRMLILLRCLAAEDICNLTQKVFIRRTHDVSGMKHLLTLQSSKELFALLCRLPVESLKSLCELRQAFLGK